MPRRLPRHADPDRGRVGRAALVPPPDIGGARRRTARPRSGIGPLPEDRRRAGGHEPGRAHRGTGAGGLQAGEGAHGLLAPLILRPESPAYGGAMVAREEGKPVFVYYALPGETVEAEPQGRRAGVSFARATNVLEASPDRVQPRSPQYGECGGCHLQHAAYERQLAL